MQMNKLGKPKLNNYTTSRQVNISHTFIFVQCLLPAAPSSELQCAVFVNCNNLQDNDQTVGCCSSWWCSFLPATVAKQPWSQSDDLCEFNDASIKSEEKGDLMEQLDVGS